MKQDESRQNEFLQRRLDARRQRRKALQEELKEVDKKIRDNEIVKEQEQEQALKEIQVSTDKELTEIKEEEEAKIQELDDKYEQMKQDKLQHFQDRLRDAKNEKSFQDILGEYQKAQQNVEHELKKSKDKQRDKILAEIKARRAQAKAKAQLLKNEKFDQIEQNAQTRVAEDQKSKELLMENLKQEENEASINGINNQIDQNSVLMEEMEKKRRDEE